MINQVDCTAKTHTIKVNLFERVDYLHKGNKQKKIHLVEKNVTPKIFVAVLKDTLEDFACHRFNVIQSTLLIKQFQACQIRQLSKFRTSQRTTLAFVQMK